jgi:signal transduction histidine kinase
MDFAREPLDERAEVALDDLTSEAIMLFRRTSISRDIEVELATGPGPLLVHGNRNALKVILLDVLMHASRVLPQSGEIHVLVAGTGATVTAAVAYPGNDARAEPGGPELGLAIAAGLARGQGGELTRDPVDEPATRFVLALPAAAPHA